MEKIIMASENHKEDTQMANEDQKYSFYNLN
jgi:hypothetical protein